VAAPKVGPRFAAAVIPPSKGERKIVDVGKKS